MQIKTPDGHLTPDGSGLDGAAELGAYDLGYREGWNAALAAARLGNWHVCAGLEAADAVEKARMA